MAAHVAAMIGFRTALAAPRALRRVPRSRAARDARGGNDGGFAVRAEIRRIASPDGTVADLPNVTFKRPPKVDRAACKSGMMHIGVGGFHRSHQQAFMNELLDVNFDVAKNWCTTGVGVMPNDAGMRDYLRDNDWTYPIVARSGTDAGNMRAEVEEVYAIRDMILAFEDPIACIEAMASPDVKIVSLTITEFGYRVPLNSGDFKFIERALNGEMDCETPYPEDMEKPSTFGIICASAAARFQRGLRPFTLMSCDNLPHNGDVCKGRMTSAAEELVCAGLCSISLDEFVVWLQNEVRYPSTMVDRITPATSWDDIATMPDKYGFEDNWPVMCEPYKHWVIEDDFVDGQRPAWERVGALLVPDVRPHELMKVRLLNVTHSAMCYVGALAGLTHVHEAVTHKMIKPFLRRLMTEEIAASLRADPTMPGELLAVLDEYVDLVLSRFENVAVKDTLDRVAMDGSEKFRVQGREVIMERLAREGTVRGFALYVAAWAHFLRRAVRDGEKIRDASAGLVAAPWEMDKENAGGPGTVGLEAFLDIEEVFGVLARHEGWRDAVKREFLDIDSAGLEATLLGAIFGVGHNSNADLSSLERARERASGTFALDETCVADTIETDEWRADDEAAVFVSLEA
mmetsp:Transcript_4140/g.16982  ORF Transcript_4140/g.16982 Transcript_4140/m.16982 type:complete len:629 (+) Transcript_4140:85-1971(+)